MTLDWEEIRVAQAETEVTHCDCCGKATVQANGDLYAGEDWLGFHWVRFSEGHPEAYPMFYVATGDWSDGAAADQRWVMALEYNKEAQGFHALDAPDTITSATPLARTDWIGSDFASQVFSLIDAIFMKDDRLKELHP